ncbi:MAG: hypothetical protein ACIAS6_03960 [Phycisphaerales bacterium JB060]
MPSTTTATKTTKLHPGRDAGERPASQPTSASPPREPEGPRTAFEGRAQKAAAESALCAILALGSARDDIKDGLELPNDIYHGAEREQAVRSIETILADLVAGLNRAVQEGGVSVAIQGEGFKLPDRPGGGLELAEFERPLRRAE